MVRFGPDQRTKSIYRIFNVNFDATTGYVRTTSDQMDPLLNPWNMDANTI